MGEKNRGKIIVMPMEGLANRLRVIVTCIKLAREAGKDLEVYWNADKGLRAEYEQLFAAPSGIVIKRPPLRYKIWVSMNLFSLRLQEISDFYLGLFKFDFVFLDRMAHLVWHKKLNLQDETRKANNSFICSCQELGFFDPEDYQVFVPLPHLRSTIKAITKKFNNKAIGIHIRSTDNEQSKIHSPFTLFLKKMEEEITKDPAVIFFVSTDNLSYQEQVIGAFGAERILFHNKEFSRNLTKGIEDAVVDMFCLSETSKIYGSYFSSFSDVAGRIGCIPVECLVKE